VEPDAGHQMMISATRPGDGIIDRDHGERGAGRATAAKPSSKVGQGSGS